MRSSRCTTPGVMVSGVQALSVLAMAVGGIALPDCVEGWDSWHGWSCNQAEACGLGRPGYGQLVPILASECPRNASKLPRCNASALFPSQLCEGDGEVIGRCKTNNSLNNCPFEYDVYQLIATTTTTTSMDWWASLELWTVSGNCTVSGRCVESGKRPGGHRRRRRTYANGDMCTLSVSNGTRINVSHFSTESCCDFLTINDRKYSGHEIEGQSFVVNGPIYWTTDASERKSGWKLCVVSQICEDRFELTAIESSECGEGFEDLPSCDLVPPGGLCEGDGECGTDKNLDNCPGDLDVYRKGNESVSTATQTFTTTMTSTLSTTTFTLAYGKLSWSVTRRRYGCTTRSISGMQCVYGNDLYDNCKVTGPWGAMVSIAENENYRRRRSSARRRFSLNGWSVNVNSSSRFRITPQHPWYDPSGQGGIDGLCLVPACADGIELTPVEADECPDYGTLRELPHCDAALPGEICEADGECGTSRSLDNCNEADVYRKATGVPTSTTPTTQTITQTVRKTFGTWSLSGCSKHTVASISLDCVQLTSGYRRRRSYGDSTCSMSVSEGADVMFTQTGDHVSNIGELTFDGQTFSSSSEVEGRSFTISDGNMVWQDPHGTWLMCLVGPHRCMGGALIPIQPHECPLQPTLPPCDSATTGELCDGHGECGTDVNLDNCGELDVYRKISTSTFTTTSIDSSDPLSWTVSGNCAVSGGCVESGRRRSSRRRRHTYESGDTCTVSVPNGSPFYVAQFSTESCCDHLIFNHHMYSGTSIKGKSFVVNGPITWKTDGSGQRAGWKLCHHAYTTSTTTQFSSSLSWTLSGNCHFSDKCVESGRRRNGYYARFDDGDMCTLLVPNGTQIKVMELDIGSDYSILTINRQDYRYSDEYDYGDGIEGKSLVVNGPITWTAHRGRDGGWKICSTAMQWTDLPWVVNAGVIAAVILFIGGLVCWLQKVASKSGSAGDGEAAHPDKSGEDAECRCVAEDAAPAPASPGPGPAYKPYDVEVGRSKTLL